MDIIKNRGIWIFTTVLTLVGLYYWTVVDQDRVEKMGSLQESDFTLSGDVNEWSEIYNRLELKYIGISKHVKTLQDETNEHYNSKTPQGVMLSGLLEVIKPRENLWYADTFSLPTFENLVRYYSGTVILYCWWDPADDRIIQHIDDMDLKFIIITMTDIYCIVPMRKRL